MQGPKPGLGRTTPGRVPARYLVCVRCGSGPCAAQSTRRAPTGGSKIKNTTGYHRPGRIATAARRRGIPARAPAKTAFFVNCPAGGPPIPKYPPLKVIYLCVARRAGASPRAPAGAAWPQSAPYANNDHPAALCSLAAGQGCAALSGPIQLTRYTPVNLHTGPGFVARRSLPGSFSAPFTRRLPRHNGTVLAGRFYQLWEYIPISLVGLHNLSKRLPIKPMKLPAGC